MPPRNLGDEPAHDLSLLPPGQAPAEFSRWLTEQRRAVRGTSAAAGTGPTTAVSAMIVGAVASTGSLTIAAGLAGRNVKTVRAWMDRGYAEQASRATALGLGQQGADEVGQYEQFFCDVLAALAWWSGRLVGIVQRAAESGNVQAAQWLLARIGPKLAAPRVEVDELGTMGGHAGEGESGDRRAGMLEELAEMKARREALGIGEEPVEPGGG